jgi:hypothetical protein
MTVYIRHAGLHHVKNKPVNEMCETRHVDCLPCGKDDTLLRDTASPVAAASTLSCREKVVLTK